MSEFHVRSFDGGARRASPGVLRGRTLLGVEREIELSRMTLVVAVKPHCQGCESFLFGDLHELSGVDVVVLSATAPDDDEWRDARREILLAPESLGELGLSAAPYYVVVDGEHSSVVSDGAVFSASQVAAETAGYFHP